MHGDGGLGVQRDPAPTPLPASSSGEEISRQQDESDTLQVAGAPRRGREDDAETARGEGAIRQCDDGSTTGEHNEYEFTYWFNLYQAIEDEAKCNGVQAALLYACDVTGWHHSALTVRTGSSGVHSCSAKLYSGEHTLDSVRGRGGLLQEAQYSTEVELLSAILRCAIDRTEETALQDAAFDGPVVERVAASLDMRGAALTSAARHQPQDVGGAYAVELKRERAVRGLSPRE